MKDLENKIKELGSQVSELKESRDYFMKEIKDLEILMINKLKNTKISFEVHLSEHCNLNCNGCDHFSPLAPPSFTNFDVFARDMERMSKIFEGEAGTIHLLGGEPLLNTEVTKFILKTRESFNDKTHTQIKIITNGLLLNSMKKEFWRTCSETGTIVSVTKYPLGLNYGQMQKIAQKNNVEFEFYDNTDKEQVWYNIKLKERGNMDSRHSFFKCFLSNNCVMLKNGKLYTCTLVPNIEHFNKYFDKEIKVTERDYIDIYKARDKNEIFDFLSNPIPFCSNCSPDEKDYSIEWKRSEKKIDEWV